jgi:DNA-binding MarR family transcriptional regulator
MKTLTSRQRKVLDFVEEFRSRTGYPPTLQEIGDAIGVRNVNAVRGHLAALEKKGYVTRTPDKARSIRVLRAPSMLSKLKRRAHHVLRTDEGVVHQVIYGLAWVTGHGKRLLAGPRREWILETLEREAVERGWDLLSMRVKEDHVALVVKVWPNHSPEQVVARFKAAGDGARRRHPGRFGQGPLWARGYVVTTEVEMLEQLLAELLDAQAGSRASRSEAEDDGDGLS